VTNKHFDREEEADAENRREDHDALIALADLASERLPGPVASTAYSEETISSNIFSVWERPARGSASHNVSFAVNVLRGLKTTPVLGR